MASFGKLVIQREGEQPSELTLDKDTISFGRAADNDVPLADARVSRYHARLTYQDGRFILTDLGSSNGTWIGNETVKEREIAPGTSFRIGRCTITLAAGPPPSPAFARTMPEGVQVPPAPSQPRPPSVPEPPLRPGPAVPPGPIPPAGPPVPPQPIAPGGVARPGATMSIPFSPSAPVAQVQHVRLDRPVLTLGRDASCDVVLSHPTVSRVHAQIRRVGDDLLLFDLNSTNGTYVGGQRVEVQRRLQPNDEIRIGSYKIVFDGVSLAPVDEAGNATVDVLHLRKVVGKGFVLLNDISLHIPPREFVAIVGVSGAGKSTLLDALNGFRPATEGAVLINGVNLYQNYNAYRSQLGYVPQEDIIHRELSVYEALSYAAELRMPADTTSAERHKRIMEVLADLDMVPAKDRVISRLSGGQRKRVSIGAELLTRPSLFYLDEATSGLDPGTEGQLMQLLARLADQGRTIMLVTHATKNVMMCDKVVFLAKGGNLAYFGPPAQALAYFGVQDFDQIYTRIERELSPKEWSQRYQQSPDFQSFVANPLREIAGSVILGSTGQIARQAPGSSVKKASALSQLAILSRRSLNITVRDKASLALMLLIAPLIGMMDLVMWKKDPFATNGGNATQGIVMLFLMSLISILVGAVASMREIVKEADIYRRERMVILQIIPYVMSKMWVGVLLAVYQSSVFIITKRLATGWPSQPDDIAKTFVTLFLATVSGMVMGLLISAVSPNQNVAPLMLILVLVPQFMFAGALMPLSTFGPAGKVLSYITTTKWGFESLVTISRLGEDVADDQCWPLPKAQRDALTEEQRKASCACLGPNVFKMCDFPGLAALYHPAVDQPEPPQPAKPGDPPKQPARPTPPAQQTAEAQKAYQDAMQRYQTDMDAFQKEMEKYQDAAKKYQDDMEAWRVRYQDWKAKHDKALNEAEGHIKKLYEDFGEMFKVDLARHWGWLAGMTGVLFALVLVAQKSKDRS